jgi:hypothetical protein
LDCVCGADWTPKEVYSLRAEVERLSLTEEERYLIGLIVELAEEYLESDDPRLVALRKFLDRTNPK